jgi:hypothetical protein
VYLTEQYERITAVYESETVVALRCENAAIRSEVLQLLMKDVMLGKKVDRYYSVDRVCPWRVDWVNEF